VVRHGELARRIGRNPSSIRRLFTAQRTRPELRLIVSIADELGARVEITAHESAHASSLATPQGGVVQRGGAEWGLDAALAPRCRLRLVPFVPRWMICTDGRVGTGVMKRTPVMLRPRGRGQDETAGQELLQTWPPPERLLDSRIGLPRPQRLRGGMNALDPEPLLRFLHEQGVAHILIGGVAVAAHGYPRSSNDLDLVPAPDSANLRRLARALALLHARPAELGDFSAGGSQQMRRAPTIWPAVGTFASRPIWVRSMSCSGSLGSTQMIYMPSLIARLSRSHSATCP